MAGTNITQELLRELLIYKDGKLFWRTTGTGRGDITTEAGSLDKVNGYRVITVNGKLYKAHRLIWLYHYGKYPASDIDHDDRDKLNNRIGNLRDVTKVENQRNRSKQSNNTSGYTGVHWQKRASKWQAYVGYLGKDINLGLFTDKEDAANIALNARIQLGFHDNHGNPSGGKHHML